MSVVQLFRREERNARGLRRHQPPAHGREPGPDLLLRGVLPGHRAPGRPGHRPHPPLRRLAGARGDAHPGRARGLHPVLRAVLAAHLRPLREVQHPAGGHGLLRAHLHAARHRAQGGRPREARAPREGAGPRRLRERVASPTSRARRVASGHRLRGRARKERGPRRRHRRGQDLDHQPAHAVLRRAAGPGDPGRGGRAGPRPGAAALVARARPAGRAPLLGHHRLEHPPRLRDPRRARARGRARRARPSLHRGPSPGLRHGSARARGHPLRGPEAAPVASRAPSPTTRAC